MPAERRAFPAVDVDALPQPAAFPPDKALWGQIQPSADAPWSVLSSAETSVMDKMRTVGTPLNDVDDCPSVKARLDAFYPRLTSRQDKRRTPYDLRSCACHQEFAEENLLWIELTDNGRFAYDDTGVYGKATTFMMTGESLKYLLATLNSALVRRFMRQAAPTSDMGTLRWKKAYIETMPIPLIGEADIRALEG